jgi:two-component system response regulator GlrR
VLAPDHRRLIGESAAFQNVLALIHKIAQVDATVLCQGETGTGKELAARAIHYLGARRDYPFIPVNCGALPDTLIENELYGHERGAYTDAREARAGLISQAQGGTLFLDEVENLSPRGQVVLLRFLQDHDYKPVGAGAVRHANVRVIAAANVDLHPMADNGAFRRDLLFRLNILAVNLPPLRERREDIVPLAEAFIERFGAQYQRPPKRMHRETIEFLESHAWPGNVRELENLIHREMLLNDSSVIHIKKPSGCAKSAGNFKEAKAQAIAQFERAYVSKLLIQTQGNISLAAKLAGKERSAFGKLVKKHGLERSRFSRDQLRPAARSSLP